MKSKNLKEIIKEIEENADYYHRTPFDEVKETYDQYVRVVISECPKSSQYELCERWDNLKYGNR